MPMCSPPRAFARSPKGSSRDPTAWPPLSGMTRTPRALEVPAGGAVHVGGYLALVPVTGRRRPRRLEHQDRAAGGRRLVLGPPGHHEDLPRAQAHGPLAAGVVE